MPDSAWPARRHGVLTVEDLRHLVDHGEVDTVLVAITDMQGRLQGKRLHARYFLDVVLGFAGIWWLVSARNWFTGPKVQGSPEELAAAERELESLA